MKAQAFFNTVEDLIAYLYTKVDGMSPLKLQKGLYFLYAYYSAMYGIENHNEESEVNYNLPQELFSENFEAWNYGPVIRSVYSLRKEGEDKFKEMAKNLNVDSLFNQENGKEVQSFIDDLFAQIYKASDFSLVDRSHEDQAWENAFKKGKSTLIKKEDIVNEYKAKFARNPRTQ